MVIHINAATTGHVKVVNVGGAESEQRAFPRGDTAMPCGGIYPIAMHFSREHLQLDNDAHRCPVCRKHVDPDTDLFCDEWDRYLHRACLGVFLTSDEGRMVLNHGHAIIVLELTDTHDTTPVTRPTVDTTTTGDTDHAPHRSTDQRSGADRRQH
jgi:hypothetical protein